MIGFISQVSQKCLERSIFSGGLRGILHGGVVIISVWTAAARTDTVAITVLVKAYQGTFAETGLGIGRDREHHEDKNSVHGRVTLSSPGEVPDWIDEHLRNDPVK
jgi:hypothetical protein